MEFLLFSDHTIYMFSSFYEKCVWCVMLSHNDTLKFWDNLFSIYAENVGYVGILIIKCPRES